MNIKKLDLGKDEKGNNNKKLPLDKNPLDSSKSIVELEKSIGTIQDLSQMLYFMV